MQYRINVRGQSSLSAKDQRKMYDSPGWALPTPAVSKSLWHRRATLAQGALTKGFEQNVKGQDGTQLRDTT